VPIRPKGRLTAPSRRITSLPLPQIGSKPRRVRPSRHGAVSPDGQWRSISVRLVTLSGARRGRHVPLVTPALMTDHRGEPVSNSSPQEQGQERVVGHIVLRDLATALVGAPRLRVLGPDDLPSRSSTRKVTGRCAGKTPSQLVFLREVYKEHDLRRGFWAGTPAGPGPQAAFFPRPTASYRSCRSSRRRSPYRARPKTPAL
jgi:hypothetical protein